MYRILSLSKYLLVLSAILSILLPYQSFALTRDQRFEIERRFWYDETDCESASTDTGTGNFTGNSNAEITYNFFVSKGLSKEQSAGIVGNFQAESGINPKSTNGSTLGIMQWLGGRRDALEKFAEATGEDVFNIETQLKYAWFEWTGEPYPPASVGAGSQKSYYDDFIAKSTQYKDTGAKGASESAEIFENELERSGGALIPQRRQYAAEAFNAFSSNTVGDSTGEGSADPCAAKGVDGTGVIDVFPLDATKTIIKTGSEGTHWCYDKTTNCHGSYNAADIMAPTGTDVVAAKAGVVVSVTNSSGGDYMTIRGSDNKYIYYYTHMGYNSITVAKDQQVTAGQVIGKVGTAAEAEGTLPHLHFDILPAARWSTRPACSRESCDQEIKDAFIDPQPHLVQLYNQLPE